MQTDRLRLGKMIIVVAGVLGGACAADSVKAAPIEIIGKVEVNGQTLTITKLDPISYLTSSITSCGQGVLYSARNDGTLWVNLNGGIGGWKKVDAGSPGPKIACDRINLYALQGNGTLLHAKTRVDGQLATIDSSGPQVWSQSHGGKLLKVPIRTSDIQGGMGNIYALVFDQSARVGTLYASELRQAMSPPGYAQGSEDSWVQLANNLGSHLATGAGSKAMYSGITTSLGYRKANRAFIANPDSTLYYNDAVLYGQNFWTPFPNAGFLIASITADDSNTMYALVIKNYAKHLIRFSFDESNCSDSLDNDANGLIDVEDSVCRGKLASDWCRGRTGSYCIDRIEHSQGQADALVTCKSGGQQPTIKMGRCTMVSPGNDSLTPDRAMNEPAGSGHYCNVISPDGSWDFDYTGSTPCQTLLDKPGRATVVRAGIYSTNHLNNVHVRCDDGWTFTAPENAGTTPLASAHNLARNFNKKRCVFTVSPKAMRVFNAPFPTSVWGDPLYGGRGYFVGHVFDHVPKCAPFDPGCPCSTLECLVALSDYGVESGSSSSLDNNGREVKHFGENQNSYDFGMNEGTPLRSLAYGRVIISRDRDLSSMTATGTPYQGEIYIRYEVGTPPYSETFVAYYAHLGKRVVVDDQTVAPGQLIGYVGTTGSSSEPHLHFGLIRLSNTNGRTVQQGDRFGYLVPFRSDLTNGYGVNRESVPGLIDPYGWRAPDGVDPMGYRWSRARWPNSSVIGIGAWSPQMWTSPSETPPYPAPKK